ncbi:MAG: hypothetical protein FWG08_00260 [Propionibacteriaceae bacterium]|nr:hypothetical protein [Propionibacteriaceae bacterium]
MKIRQGILDQAKAIAAQQAGAITAAQTNSIGVSEAVRLRFRPKTTTDPRFRWSK